jgi:hypothetical protein
MNFKNISYASQSLFKKNLAPVICNNLGNADSHGTLMKSVEYLL